MYLKYLVSMDSVTEFIDNRAFTSKFTLDHSKSFDLF